MGKRSIKSLEAENEKLEAILEELDNEIEEYVKTPKLVSEVFVWEAEYQVNKNCGGSIVVNGGVGVSGNIIGDGVGLNGETAIWRNSITYIGGKK